MLTARLTLALVWAAALWSSVSITPAFAFSGTGSIGPFSPIQCSSCPTTTEVPFSYSSTELPNNPNCSGIPSACPHYTNWLDHYRYIVANRFVTQWGFYNDTFSLEQGDCLKYSATISGSWTSMCGAQSSAWRDIPKTSGQHYQGGFGALYFDTDQSGTDTGFAITRSRVCCSQSPPVAYASIPPGQRIDGVLLGNKDTIYLQFTSDANQNIVALWADDPIGNDFDLYARCNALPTPTSFDSAWNGATGQDMMYLNASGCPNPGTWWLAIHSHEGAGGFHIVLSKHKLSHIHTLKAGTDHTLSSAEMTKAAGVLVGGMRTYFGATEGNCIVSKIDLWNSANCSNCGGSSCDICFTDDIFNAQCTAIPGGRVDLGRRFYETATSWPLHGLAHEWGHCLLGLPDEYTPPACTTCSFGCGHSIMADASGNDNQNNFCYHTTTGSTEDHARDYHPLDAGPAGGSSNWDTLASGGIPVTVPLTTPDNYHYANHPCQGIRTEVVVH